MSKFDLDVLVEQFTAPRAMKFGTHGSAEGLKSIKSSSVIYRKYVQHNLPKNQKKNKKTEYQDYISRYFEQTLSSNQIRTMTKIK